MPPKPDIMRIEVGAIGTSPSVDTIEPKTIDATTPIASARRRLVHARIKRITTGYMLASTALVRNAVSGPPRKRTHSPPLPIVACADFVISGISAGSGAAAATAG